jgi:hypothetical protein
MPVPLPELPASPTVETSRDFLETIDGVAEREALAERLINAHSRSEVGLERVAEAVLYAERLTIPHAPDLGVLERIRARHRDAAIAWEADILEHFEHPTFRMFDSLWQLQFGFTCECTEGPVLQRPVSMAALEFLSRAVQALIGSLPRVALEPPGWFLALDERNYPSVATKSFRRKEKGAWLRARALLHQMLTREQRWSLRASGGFQVQGQDGRTYEVSKTAVRLIVDGKPRVSYCIHPKERLPAYDVMLAQKLLLESNVQHFLATANARDLDAARAG